ncbi:hypothetical protein ACUXV3_19955 (plasmid) [Roseobacteraceae bacterium NS-SX3]
MTAASKPAKSETLVSFLLVSSRSAAADLACLRRMSEYAVRNYDFFEIMILAAAPGERWLEAIRAGGTSVANLRCIVFGERQDYDELLFQGLGLSIGDVIYCDTAPGAPEALTDALLADCLEQGYDLAKSVAPANGRLTPGAVLLKAIQIGLFAFLGRQIDTRVQRALCLTRAAAARILESGGAHRYFRLVAQAGQFRESRIESPAEPEQNRFREFARKAQIAAFLVSTAAPRLLAGVAAFTLFLCLLSLSYTVYSLVIWLVLDTVSEGWTSLSLVLSVLFAANFGVLAALSIGVLQLLRTARPRRGPPPALEINNSDLFAQAKNYNVEIGEEA